MKIREALELEREYVRKLTEKHFPNRTGIHATDLNYCLRKQVMRVQGRKEGSYVESTGAVMQYLRGQALHVLLTVGEGEKEYEWEGVVCHPDDVVDGVLYEYKTTLMSSELTKTRTEALSDSWLRQAMTYALAVGTVRVVFVVMHLMGNYKDRVPCLKVWDVLFEEKELMDHAKWVRERRDVWREALDRSVLPGVQYRAWETECKGCDFELYCQKEVMEERSARG